jgi:hypothetical protein
MSPQAAGCPSYSSIAVYTEFNPHISRDRQSPVSTWLFISTQCRLVLYCIITVPAAFLDITQQQHNGITYHVHHAVFDVSAPRGRLPYLVGFNRSFTPQVPYWAHVVYLIEYYILSFAIGFRTAVCAIDLGLVKNVSTGWLEDPQGENVSARLVFSRARFSVSWRSMFPSRAPMH